MCCCGPCPSLVKTLMINFLSRPAGPAVECFELVHCGGGIGI